MPAWAPGGGRIVYVHTDTRDYDDKLWIMAADGSHNAPFGDQNGDATEPAWSAGGGEVAFTYHS
jgi:Tol biopolymer transport system component